jgi:precorrin-3B synthase
MNVYRRGACPGLSSPMATGDGLLVRIVPKDRIAPEALIAACTAARRHGNGVVEITARGSLQVRGLTARSVQLFAAVVADLEIAEPCTVPVITDPLPDDPNALIDTAAIASELRKAIDQARLALAAKVSVVLDGGSRLHLDAISADVRLRAFGSQPAPRLHVALGGNAPSAMPLGAILPTKAADIAVRLLGVIAARGPTARAADILRTEGIAPFRAAVPDHIEASPVLAARGSIEPIGQHPLRDGGFALGIAPAYGQTDTEALARIACIAADHGARSTRPAPGRVLLLSGFDENSTAAVAAAAAQLGFIVRGNDPRRFIAACPGKPACASGWIEARALAAELAQHLLLHSGGIDVHISGCAKGCAHPGPAGLTVVGSERGFGIVRHGSAGATPHCYVDRENLAAEIARAVHVSEAPNG